MAEPVEPARLRFVTNLPSQHRSHLAMWQVLQYLLFGAAVISLACAALLFFWYSRVERRNREQYERARLDITDMSILFQTMRDIIGQQKTMAHQFNDEMDRKMLLVKQILTRSMEKNERLYEKQHALSTELAEAQAQIESLQRQLTYLPKLPISDDLQPATRPYPASQPTEQECPKSTNTTQRPFETSPSPKKNLLPQDNTLDSIPNIQTLPDENHPLAETGINDAPFTKWELTDFDVHDPDAGTEELNIPLPEAPEDAQAARSAFRALLNLDAPLDNTPATTQESSPITSPSAGGNGAGVANPVRHRVVEYNEAGMSIAEISRELGIGKGEIRLILNLAKQERR